MTHSNGYTIQRSDGLIRSSGPRLVHMVINYLNHISYKLRKRDEKDHKKGA